MAFPSLTLLSSTSRWCHSPSLTRTWGKLRLPMSCSLSNTSMRTCCSLTWILTRDVSKVHDKDFNFSQKIKILVALTESSSPWGLWWTKVQRWPALRCQRAAWCETWGRCTREQPQWYQGPSKTPEPGRQSTGGTASLDEDKTTKKNIVLRDYKRGNLIISIKIQNLNPNH